MNSSCDGKIPLMPKDPHLFKDAASRPSPTPARHHDQIFFKKNRKVYENASSSSESSSTFTDFDTAHSRSDPVQLHLTGQCTEKMNFHSGLGSSDTMEDEAIQPQTKKRSHRDLTPEDTDRIVERYSPRPRLLELEAGHTVGHVPAAWPKGSRNVAHGHCVCPYKGCEYPIGPNGYSGEGYSRKTLAPHMQSSHGGGTGVDDLRWAVRGRVRDLRRAQGRSEGDEDAADWMCDHQDLQQKTDSLFLDLHELQNSGESGRSGQHIPAGSRAARHVPDAAADDDNNDEASRCQASFRDMGYRDSQEAAEEADDESTPVQHAIRFRKNRFRRSRPKYHRMRRINMASSPSSHESETDDSQAPPRKRARRCQPQLNDSSRDSTPSESEDAMELD